MGETPRRRAGRRRHWLLALRARKGDHAALGRHPTQERVVARRAAGQSCTVAMLTAQAVTMSSTFAPRDRSVTGLAKPCSRGPIAVALPSHWTSL